MSLEVKRGLRNSILLPTLTYGSETWTCNTAQQSRVCAVEINDLIEACSVTRSEHESNESAYERCSMGPCAQAVKCGVVESVKKKLYEVVWLSGEKEEWRVCEETEGPRMRGRLVVRWKVRMKEYIHERGASKGKKCKGGGSSAMAIPLVDVSKGNEAS